AASPAAAPAASPAAAPAASPAAAPAASPAAAPAATSAAAALPNFKGASVRLTVSSWFIPPANDELKAMVKEWSDKTGANAEVEFVSEADLTPKLATAAETGAGPDILQLSSSAAHVYSDKLADLDDVAEDLGKQNGGWHDIGKAANFVSGHWKAIPLYITPQVMNYREDVLKEIGEQPPDTWEDALRIGKKLKAANKPLWAEPLGQAPVDANTTIYSIMWGFGAKEVEQDGKTIALKSPEMVKALEFIRQAYQEAWPEGVLGWDNSGNNRAFLGGQLAMTINAASIYWAAKENAPSLRPNINHALIPKGSAQRATNLWPTSLAIFNYSKQQEAAKSLVRYLTDLPQLVRWLAKTEGAAAGMLKDVEKAERRDPKMQIIPKAVEFGHLPGWPGPPTRQATEVYAKFTLVNMAASVCRGTPINTAIDTTVAEMKKIYGQA
ncbi:MAG: extracellular solute-binding protein, partial [Chloroflexi bacterium]|nr:extracellular solute-binding protein [Chloroflexota bacterium]